MGSKSRSLGPFKPFEAVGRADRKLVRTWLIIVYVLSVGFGLPLMFSCYSPQTKSLHIYSVSAQTFLHDYFIVTGPNMTNLRTADLSRLPDTFYFGVSGVCTESNATGVICERSFPPAWDIAKVVLQAVARETNLTQLSSSRASDDRDAPFAVTSTTAGALLVVSMAWSLPAVVAIFAVPDRAWPQAIFLPVLFLASVGAWLTGNSAFWKQALLWRFNTSNPLDTRVGTPRFLAVGPGFGVWTTYLACTAAMTPPLALVSAYIVASIIVLVVLAFVCMAACAACCAGGGGAVGGEGDDGLTSSQRVDTGYHLPNYYGGS